MKRSPLKRKTRLTATARPSGPRKRTKYASRPRDIDYMMWVKGMPCAVNLMGFPSWEFESHSMRCSGPIEADHMGDRGLGRKAADDTCAPLCQLHHRHRTDHTGLFRHATKEQLREWRDLVISKVRLAWNRRNNGDL